MFNEFNLKETQCEVIFFYSVAKHFPNFRNLEYKEHGRNSLMFKSEVYSTKEKKNNHDMLYFLNEVSETLN